MTEIKNIFDSISSISGTKDKINELAKYKADSLLEKVLYLAKSKKVKFNIKQIPEYSYNGKDYPLNLALTELEKIYKSELTGASAKEHLTKILSSVNPDNAYIIERIIEKNPKIGMGTTNMNKVFTSLIEKTPYMGAKSYSEKLLLGIIKSGNAVSQTKMDGRYTNILIRSNDVYAESRGGEQTFLSGALFMDELSRFDDCVLNGELTMKNVASRYEANGIIASLTSIGEKADNGEDVVKEILAFEKDNNMTFQEALDNIVLTVWDVITVQDYFRGASHVTYSNRLANVVDLLIKYPCDNVKLIESKPVKTFSDAIADFQQKLELGLEGTIVKDLNGAWKDGKPSYQVKMKLIISVDMKIIGFEYGTKGSKNENVISTLIVESNDGLVKTNPSNMKEKMMSFVTQNQDKLLGTIVEIECCGLSKNSKNQYSLLHPRVSELRSDKTTCDDLQSIMEIENMAKSLK